jgi:hypothetical protein
VDDSGNVQGVITIPSSVLQGAGTISIASAVIPDGTDLSNVGSVVVNVTLLDETGNEITSLDSSVELCLSTQKQSSSVS